MTLASNLLPFVSATKAMYTWKIEHYVRNYLISQLPNEVSRRRPWWNSRLLRARGGYSIVLHNLNFIDSYTDKLSMESPQISKGSLWSLLNVTLMALNSLTLGQLTSRVMRLLSGVDLPATLHLIQLSPLCKTETDNCLSGWFITCGVWMTRLDVFDVPTKIKPK